MGKDKKIYKDKKNHPKRLQQLPPGKGYLKNRLLRLKPNFLSYLFLEFPLPVLLDEPLPATLYGSSSLLPAPTPVPMLTCWRSCCRLSRTPPPRLITSTMKISFIGWTYREILNNIGIKDGVIAFCICILIVEVKVENSIFSYRKKIANYLYNISKSVGFL